jgi:hypothetical protein
MRTTLATYALAGALGLSGVAGAAFVAPAVSYAATGDSTALDARITSLKEALAGLVSDGSLTQAQADEVAATLAEARPEGYGRGGHGGGGRIDMAAAAEALGISEEELRTQTSAGRTLADIAEAEGVEEADLVDALVAAAKTRLAEAVTAGRLTQAEADARAADLEARITDSLDELCGPGGRSGRGPAGGDDAEDAAEDSATPSTAPSAGTSSDA